MKVRKWINSLSGVSTLRVTVRVEHHLSLDEMVDGLCSHYVRDWDVDDNGPRPTRLSAREIVDTVRDEYAQHGIRNVWTWSDGEPYDRNEAHRLWARLLILDACPEFRDPIHREGAA